MSRVESVTISAVDLNFSSLRDHYRTRLFPDRNAVLAYAQLGPVASHISGKIAESVHSPMSPNTRFLWDGRIWTLVNLGETTTTLLPEIGEPIQLSSAFFLHLLETHTVTIPSEGKPVQNAREIQERMAAANPADMHTANERFRDGTNAHVTSPFSFPRGCRFFSMSDGEPPLPLI